MADEFPRRWLCSGAVRGTKRSDPSALPSSDLDRTKGEEGGRDLRTDLLGIDEMAQPFSAAAILRFSALVLQRESHLGEGKRARGRDEYPIFLRSDQSLRGVADGIDAFFLDIAGYSGRTVLHADGDYLLIALLSLGSQQGLSDVCR